MENPLLSEPVAKLDFDGTVRCVMGNDFPQSLRTAFDARTVACRVVTAIKRLDGAGATLIGFAAQAAPCVVLACMHIRAATHGFGGRRDAAG